MIHNRLLHQHYQHLSHNFIYVTSSYQDSYNVAILALATVRISTLVCTVYPVILSCTYQYVHQGMIR